MNTDTVAIPVLNIKHNSVNMNYDQGYIFGSYKWYCPD